MPRNKRDTHVPLRIANWNLDRATESWRRDCIRERMAKVNAQVWVLTESRDSVAPGTAYDRVAESVAYARGDNDERWVSIWTSLSNAIPLKTRDERFSACAIINTAAGVAVAVYGTVLPWRGSTWRDVPSAGARAYKAALHAQAQDWRELVETPWLRGVCVAGDFNQDLSDTHYYWSREAQALLRREFVACKLDATTGDPTDPVRRVTDGAAACIDHICLSRGLLDRQSGKSRAWLPIEHGRTLSDHPGVWIELKDV